VNKFTLGWSTQWDRLVDECAPEQIVRIIAKHKTMYEGINLAGSAINCHLTGKMLHEYTYQHELPAVGDWCITEAPFIDQSNNAAALVQTVLPRRSQIARVNVSDGAEEQVLAANIDFLFVVTSINRDFNLNRLRRYLLLAETGHCQMVVVLSKCDIAEEIKNEALDAVEGAFPGVPCIATSSLLDTGIDAIKECLNTGLTGVFVGSSGVGKSTLINKLLESEVQRTGEIREDGKGKHTTSGSAMFFLDCGGIIIDTAGIREVGLVGDTSDVDSLMPAFGQIAAFCRFADCTHEGEPGCAVAAAIANGTLDPAEIYTYRKMKREVLYHERKQDRRLAERDRKKWKQITTDNRRASKERYRQ
jgi:ribosome biogenesis GTPase